MSEGEFLNIRIWYLPGNEEIVNFSTSEYDTCQAMENMAMWIFFNMSTSEYGACQAMENMAM